MIRPYQQKDREEVLGIYTYSDPTKKKRIEVKINAVERLDNWYGFVAEDDGGIVGYVLIEDLIGGMYVSELAVKEGYRLHGIGTSLMKEVEELAREKACKNISLNCNVDNPNKEFYKKIGFEESGSQIGYREGQDKIWFLKRVR
ncbi:MAG: GNAT family N-acetyltransferase [Candidatus Diapherotrites archaeon]|nr:GNAT family N-acetyltransferase [Candidatus Diapherotrites archaeon]